jgi:Fe-S oxidoreductase
LIKCIECGLCRESCPVFKVVRRESVSPRGFAIMKKKEQFNKLFYLCSLCNNCKISCPYDVDLELEKTREYVAKHGEPTEAIKEVIENLKETGNPYGVRVGVD